jgi:D-3-phosphoglycerate dehydrogenase
MTELEYEKACRGPAQRGLKSEYLGGKMLTDAKKVLITLSFHPDKVANFDAYVDRLRQKGFDVFVDPRYRTLSEDELIEVLPDYDVYIMSSEYITPKVAAAADSLKIVSRMGVGFNRLDMDALTQKGVAVTIAVGANAEPVAEFTVAMLLSLTRKIFTVDRLARSGSWEKCFGTSLYRKTLGVVGLGNIGRLVVKLLAGFDMRVLAFDPVQEE